MNVHKSNMESDSTDKDVIVLGEAGSREEQGTHSVSLGLEEHKQHVMERS